MKEIKVGCNGHKAIVDDWWYTYLNQFNWHVASIRGDNWHAYRRVKVGHNKYKNIWMHREIANTPEDMEVDHKNRRGYDNREENLRNCTRSQNLQNTVTHGKYGKGVSYHEDMNPNKYKAMVVKNGIRHIIGFFFTPRDAMIAYNKLAVELFGEFARLNIIEELEEGTI